MEMSAAIRALEEQWDIPDGFFYRLRQGDYDPRGTVLVENILRSLAIDEEMRLPRRFVSLTWWIPMFMEWQAERVREAGGDAEAVLRDSVRLRNALDEVLRVPRGGFALRPTICGPRRLTERASWSRPLVQHIHIEVKAVFSHAIA